MTEHEERDRPVSWIPQYLPLFMLLGALLGAEIGRRHGNLVLGISIGMCAGILLMTVIAIITRLQRSSPTDNAR